MGETSARRAEISARADVGLFQFACHDNHENLVIVFLIFLTDCVKSLITSVSHVSFQVLIPHNFNTNKLYFKILWT